MQDDIKIKSDKSGLSLLLRGFLTNIKQELFYSENMHLVIFIEH